MIETPKFCVVKFYPMGEKFMGTLYTDSIGADGPKDLWFENNWVSIRKVSKAMYNTGYTVTGHYVDLPDEEDLK